jgi:ABC-type dipeptide/oligopeptide/nickel transport system ATPase component
VTVLSQGKVVESGPVKRVFERPENPYTIRLMEDVPKVIRGEPQSRLPAP